MLDYAHLEALLAVEREKSFEGAARALGVTSSAISQRIKLLEERIGAVALNRQTPVSTTDVGAQLCRHAEMVLMLEEDVIQRNRKELGYFDEGFRKIKIAVNDDSLSSWFMGVLKANAASGNPFLLEISIADQDYSIDWMKTGSALAAISIHKNPVQGFQSTYLGTHIYRATASPTFMERYFPDGVTLETLAEAPSLRYSSKDDLQIQWIKQVFKEVVHPHSHTIPSSHGFVSACLEDVAWGMHPALMVDDYIAEGKLVELAPGQTLDKPLFWHCSRVIAEPFKNFTKTVIAEADKLLDQSSRNNPR
jgi:LysR family transcriptional regulator (chromosome initiation inhibitor)